MWSSSEPHRIVLRSDPSLCAQELGRLYTFPLEYVAKARELHSGLK
jgi:hypothetical protein